MRVRIGRTSLDEIDRHAVETYPYECCGAVLVGGGTEQVRRIANIQDRLHAEDPVAHPRDARTAYFMDPDELYAVLREADEKHHRIRFIYHSHPDHGAYFSDEDTARATAWDEPAYPDACFLVVSVVAGSVKDRLVVVWDPRRRQFVPTELAVD